LTLRGFKNFLKLTLISGVIALYGLAAFAVGKFTAAKNLPEVKGARTESSDSAKIEKPQPYTDIQSGLIIASSVNLCSNIAYSFQISYPKDWFTTYNNKYQECTYFAPYSFVVPNYPEYDIVPITVIPVTPQDWAATVKLYENPNDYQNVLSAKTIEINGRSTEIIDSTSTGSGFIPLGFAKKTYLIFDGRIPLVMYYQQLNAKEDVEQAEKVLEEMVSSLKYF